MYRLFVDTANIDDIKKAFERGVVSGVTTNPSLMAKEPKTNYVEHMKRICEVIEPYDAPPLSVEVFCKDVDGMYDQAHELIEQIGYSNINIKIPIGSEELKVISKLSKENVRVNCTCCFTPEQLALGALAGSRYVSLFYNRAIDAEETPQTSLAAAQTVIIKNELDCEIIAGSIRKPFDICDVWLQHGNIVTAGYNIIEQAFDHPGTKASVEGFMNDFKDWIE